MMNANRRFYDALRLFVRAGSGGNGHPKFGGLGGKGGDVFAEGQKEINFTHSKKYYAEKKPLIHGENSRRHKVIGDAGTDIIIPVPCGSTVHADHGPLIGEIVEAGEQILLAQGGEGGCIENKFIGSKGESHHIRFYLKLIADIGLVGFPNAGKSTLLRAISQAKPKVANYPFTTLHPMVGIMNYDDKRAVSMADLPGLIEGSSHNFGMGHKFLRHLERTKLLLFVIDIQGFRLSPMYPYRTAMENVILLNKEIEMYNPDLLDKPCLLLVNKMDKPNAKELLKNLSSQMFNMEESCKSLPEEMRPERFVEFENVFLCSAKYDQKSVLKTKEILREVLDKHCDSLDEKLLSQLNEKLKDELYEQTGKLA